MNEWQPIETCKETVEVLAWNGYWHVWADFRDGKWYDHDGEEFEPTHWYPVPPPPPRKPKEPSPFFDALRELIREGLKASGPPETIPDPSRKGTEQS